MQKKKKTYNKTVYKKGGKKICQTKFTQTKTKKILITAATFFIITVLSISGYFLFQHLTKQPTNSKNTAIEPTGNNSGQNDAGKTNARKNQQTTQTQPPKLKLKEPKQKPITSNQPQPAEKEDVSDKEKGSIQKSKPTINIGNEGEQLAKTTHRDPGNIKKDKTDDFLNKHSPLEKEQKPNIDAKNSNIEIRESRNTDGSKNIIKWDIKNQQIIQKSSYHPDGSIRSIEDYDSKTGKKTKDTCYDADGFLWSIDEYDPKTGKITKTTIYETDGPPNCIIVYDPITNNCTEKTIYNYDGSIWSIADYDPHTGNRIKYTEFKRNGSIIFAYDFDRQTGQKTKYTSYNPDGSIKEIENY